MWDYTLTKNGIKPLVGFEVLNPGEYELMPRVFLEGLLKKLLRLINPGRVPVDKNVPSGTQMRRIECIIARSRSKFSYGLPPNGERRQPQITIQVFSTLEMFLNVRDVLADRRNLVFAVKRKIRFIARCDGLHDDHLFDSRDGGSISSSRLLSKMCWAG